MLTRPALSMALALAGACGDERPASEDRPPGVCPADAWTIEDAGMVFELGELSIAADGDGRVHVAFQDAGLLALGHAERAPEGTWSFEIVDNAFDAGWFPAIALTPAGDVHIVHRNSNLPSLDHAVRPAAGTWSLDALVTSGNPGIGTSLVADDAGRLLVSHIDLDTDQLMLGIATAALDWSFTPVDALVDPGASSATSLAVGAGGDAGIVYTIDYQGTIGYARLSPPDAPSLETVAEDVFWAQPPAVAVTADGATHAVFYRQHQLIDAERGPDGIWSETVIHTRAEHRGSRSLAADADGGLHLVFDPYETDDVLGYAYRSPDGEWGTTVVDTVPGGPVGGSVAMTVDPAGGVHVVYPSPDTESFKYARCTPP